jgi:hypothetical protein
MTPLLRLAALVLLVVGIVLSPMRALAATIPALFAYDVPVPHPPTVRVGASPSLRPEGSTVARYIYDDVPDGHVGRTKLHTGHGTGSVHVYDAALEVTERREAANGVIYVAPAAPPAAEEAELGAAEVGDTVFRVYGENNNPLGQSWSRVDPSSVENYRDVAGLPDVNTGRFVIEGQLMNIDGVTVRSALALDGNAGGIDEVLIPNAASQVQIQSVSGVNPEF